MRLPRNPREYFAIFDAATAAQPDGRRARFELVSCKCVDTYVRVKHNQNQARLDKLLEDVPKAGESPRNVYII